MRASSIFQYCKHAYLLLRFHHPEQFFFRALIRLTTPFKYHWHLKLQRERLVASYSTRKIIPSLIDYKKKIIPLTLTNPKFSLTPLNDLIAIPNSKLAEFELHSHRNVLKEPDFFLSWRLILDWITQFPFSTRRSYQVGWHPYVISKRVQHWLALWVLSPPPEKDRQKILQSLFFQISWLESNLERDIKGNHLWENAQALILGGSFFEGATADRWLKNGIVLIKKCFKTQLLPWGEHFERSPSYHLELSHGLSFLVPWLEKIEGHQTEANHLKERAKKMLNFACEISHPNGLLPFFNDSWKMEAPHSEHFLQSWIGDYFISRQKDLFLIFDAGNLGPDALPAHSHCDLLTFEMSVGNRPVFINSGTFSYQGVKRELYRSSPAHNVLVLNRKNSADIWSSFRMGRRGHVLNREKLKTAHGVWTWASHNGYSFLDGATVIRGWFISTTPSFVCSFHCVTPSQKINHLQEFIHLDPGVEILKTLEPRPAQILNRSLLLKTGSLHSHFGILGASHQITLEDTMFSPHFNTEIPNKTISILSDAHQRPLGTSEPLYLATAWYCSLQNNFSNISLELKEKTIKLSWEYQTRLFSTELQISIP